MSWSTKRKSKYFLFFFIVFLATTLFLIFKFFYVAPSCFDGKQNQGEEGIDCGGPCEIVCSFDVVDPIVKWKRFIKLRDGVYSAVVLIENANVGAEAFDIPYQIKLYDNEGILISERIGKIYIPDNRQFPIFETNFQAGGRLPERMTFNFLTDNFKWVQKESLENGFSVLNTQFQEKNDSPRVIANIENKGTRDIDNLELVVLLYDDEKNLINSSKTFFDKLEKNSTERAIFTWPNLFEKEVAKIEIIPVSKLD